MNGLNVQQIVALVLEELRGMWRYRWLANLTSWAIFVVGWYYVSSLPDIYRATTRVFVDTSSLLTPLLAGLTAPTNTMDQVQLLSRSVLTRPNLSEVAYGTDLALEAATPEQFEAIVTGLQNNIQVGDGRDNIFTITYEHRDRDKAREVVAAILDTFVEGALGNTGDDAETTERALASEIEVHERRLREAEETLARFKQQNLGYMPDSHGDYYNRLQAALSEVRQTRERLRLATERRDELRRQMEGEEPVFGIMTAAVGQAVGGCSQETRIGELEAQLAQFRLEYTDRHPRVTSLQETIMQLREECEVEIAARGSESSAAAVSAPPLETNPVYQNLRLQLSAVDLELSELRAQLAMQEGQVTQLREDTDRITEVETQLKQLNRDYDVVLTRHQEYLRRWEDLQAKKRLDPVTDSVQFRRIEPPFALAEPVGPNRPFLLAVVFIFAVGVGLVLAFGLSQLRPVFFSRSALRGVVQLPVLGSISMILTPQDRLRRRIEALAWGGAYGALAMSAVLATAFAGESAAFVRSLAERLGA